MNTHRRVCLQLVWVLCQRNTQTGAGLLTPKTVKGSKEIFSNITWAFYGENEDIILRWDVQRSWAMWFEHGPMGFGDVVLARWASSDYLHGQSAENLPEGSTKLEKEIIYKEIRRFARGGFGNKGKKNDGLD